MASLIKLALRRNLRVRGDLVVMGAAIVPCRVEGSAPAASFDCLWKLPEPKRMLGFYSGNDMLVAGALRAGCNFFAGYPISPATPILVGMLRELPKRGGVGIEVEDEIASIGFCIGASMAGSKAALRPVASLSRAPSPPDLHPGQPLSSGWWLTHVGRMSLFTALDPGDNRTGISK